jgi:large subunit ribosomal protein L17
MLRNQATALLRYEHLTTTVPRAKELRPFVERLITIAKRAAPGNGSGKDGASGRALHARRLVLQDIVDREVVSKLFDSIAPRFVDRAGGYTRLLRVGYRRGDSAEVAHVELVGSEFNPRAAAEAETKGEDQKQKQKVKGVGGRLRAAAERLRGGKKAEASASSESAAAIEAKAAKRSTARKAPASRKTGGD